MGDRCYLSLTMRQSDLKAFRKFVPWDGEEWWNEREDYEDGTADLTVEGADYAWTGELIKAAEEGHLPFYGQHGPGGCYGSEVFASDGKAYAEKEASFYGLPAVEYGMDSKPCADSLRVMRRFVSVRKRAVKAVHKKGTENG